MIFRTMLALGFLLSLAPIAEAATAKKPCVISGCSGELCTLPDKNGDPLPGICIWREEFACYQQKGAVCKLQKDGKCGWNQTRSLKTCLQKTKAI